MIQLKNVCKDYGTKTVLDKINLTIYDGEKIGIIGENGQGKTSLLNIITKQIPADSGEIISEDTFGFLRQSSELSIPDIVEELSDSNLATQFNIQLKKMGFIKELDLSVERIEKLSCGERTKIALALIFAKYPTTLVLDEPTNHLDLTGQNIIVQQINQFAGTVLIVSHNKDFLNKTVQKIVEIKDGNIKEYSGNYDDYKIQKENEQLDIKRTYEEHSKKIVKINADIDRYRQAASIADKKKSNRVKTSYTKSTADERSKSLSQFASNRISKLQQELGKDIEQPDREKQIYYKLQKEDIKIRFAFVAEHLNKKFGDSILFQDANFTIEAGEKIALMGDNGSGKTTLINILLGKESYDGVLRVYPSLKIATMYQDVYDIDQEVTINEMSLQEDKDFRTRFITNLCSMNIDKSRFDTKIKFLSSGEKMRIKLAQLILSDANMIILDEPNNHLDILNKDYLEKVLAGYEGTVLIVSHDMEFLKNTTNKVLKIQNKTITKYDEF